MPQEDRKEATSLADFFHLGLSLVPIKKGAALRLVVLHIRTIDREHERPYKANKSALIFYTNCIFGYNATCIYFDL